MYGWIGIEIVNIKTIFSPILNCPEMFKIINFWLYVIFYVPVSMIEETSIPREDHQPRQTIYLKCQVLLSQKDNKYRISSAAVVITALRVDIHVVQIHLQLQWCKFRPLLFHALDHSSGPEVIKLFSCSTQLSMNFVLLINLRLLTAANSFLLNTAEHENFSANKYENANNMY